MQTKKIEVGKRYKIKYREGNKPKLVNGRYSSTDRRPLKDGYGTCIKLSRGELHAPHIFRLDSGKDVTCTSNGVLCLADTITSPPSKKFAKEIAQEIDDDTIQVLQDNLSVVQSMLEGLGVKSTIEGTKLVLSYKDAITFKVLAAKVLLSEDIY